MNFDEQFNSYIGVDETGVGDYFTPVVSVACFIPKNNIDEIINLGVKDSKKLNDKKIIAIAKKLFNLVFYKKTILTQSGYNKLIESKINNNEIKTLIHANSINRLSNELNKKNNFLYSVIIDQYVLNESILEKHFNKLLSTNWINFNKPINNLELKTKAEDVALPVACASIIARYLLLEEMQKQNKKYNFVLPLGTNKKIIDAGVELLSKIGIPEFKSLCKFSFKTSQEILDKFQNNTKES